MTSPISPEGTVPGGTWRIEYDNDTGPDDGYFHQWWTVTNGEVSFKCDAEKDAKLLLAHLNETLPALKQRVEELEKMLADTEDALEWHAANEARFWGIEDVHGYAKAAKNLLIKVKQALTPKDKATE